MGRGKRRWQKLGRFYPQAACSADFWKGAHKYPFHGKWGVLSHHPLKSSFTRNCLIRDESPSQEPPASDRDHRIRSLPQKFCPRFSPAAMRSGGWSARGLVAAPDPVSCGSQRPHSFLGSEGAIVPSGGIVGAVGGLASEGRNASGEIAPGFQSPGPRQISIGPLHDPKPSPTPAPPPSPLAPRSLHASPEGGDRLGAGEASPHASGSLGRTFSGAGSCPAPRVLTDC